MRSINSRPAGPIGMFETDWRAVGIVVSKRRVQRNGTAVRFLVGSAHNWQSLAVCVGGCFAGCGSTESGHKASTEQLQTN